MNHNTIKASDLKFEGSLTEVTQPSVLRPILQNDTAYVIVYNRAVPYTAMLPSTDGVFFNKYEWSQMDRVMLDTVQPRISVSRAFAAKELLVKNDTGFISRDYAHPDYGDLPMPFISKEFMVDEGYLYSCEACAHAVAEKAEWTILGVGEPFVQNNVALYGLCNHPHRKKIPIVSPFTENGERSGLWKSEFLYQELAQVEYDMFESGHRGEFTLFLSPEWIRAGIKPQHLTSFLFKDVVLTEYLPPGNIVAVEMSRKVIHVLWDMDFSVLQWYPRAGTACDRKEVEMRVACRVVPIIHNGLGIAHFFTSSPSP